MDDEMKKKLEKPSMHLSIMGMDIPLDEVMLKMLNDVLRGEMMKIINTDTFANKMSDALMIHKKYFKKHLTPIVKEIITEDLTFKATLDLEDGY